MTRIATPFTMTAALLFLLSPARAQQEAADGTSPRVTVLRAARLFDGKSDTLLAGLRVVIDGTTIKTVEPAEAPLDPDIRVIDCGGRVLMPGLIDAHWQAAGQLSQHDAAGTHLGEQMMRVESGIVAAYRGTRGTPDDVRSVGQERRTAGVGTGIPCEGPEFVHCPYKACRERRIGSSPTNNRRTFEESPFR